MYTGINTTARLPVAIAIACLLASPMLSAVEIEQRPLSAATPAPVAKATTTSTTALGSPAQAKGLPTAASNPAWDMFQQLEDMRASIARLQGTVEEQQQLIERLQSDLRTRYTDLDQRIEQLNKPIAPAPAPVIAPVVATPEPVPVSVPAVPQPVESPAVIKSAAAPAVDISPEELSRQKTAYLVAYQSYARNGAATAISAMTDFLAKFPDSVFAPNAYYWLGEFQLKLEPANLVSAEANFQRVLRDYSASPKVASAYYKLGVIVDKQGKRKASRDWMMKLINQYPNSDEARLAQTFLEQNDAK